MSHLNFYAKNNIPFVCITNLPYTCKNESFWIIFKHCVQVFLLNDVETEVSAKIVAGLNSEVTRAISPPMLSSRILFVFYDDAVLGRSLTCHDSFNHFDEYKLEQH